ncbi:lytic polysaccharide monooxygenase [Streptomyces roseirectus]|uniref:Lytic polysaccharide monooxygenase n=1 Tax=Streptomyces roseirectus TaxID=2768066 RepID=A0A7H0I9Q8_9ACTN|nr:lytic polysaccharide monooxygenase [Streptomyces roseirectus]QNP69524.1 lytic polysaccharide monooxygenase [Streptomyces roseirectus]
MSRHRLVPLAAAVLGTLVATTGPAAAHGAPTNPVSRVFACSPDGGANADTAACRAAVRANGTSFAAWDNLRVADVNGRDRETVPDGELCSGGLAAYRGLDLARADWPATRLAPGGTLRMTYVSTIPHTGSFELYLTKPGYDPAKPLTWSDLPARPFAVATDPRLTDGAYRFTAKLPADRTGRQVLYTIWRNTSTADTYYSCSDVVFPETPREAKPARTPEAKTSEAKTPEARAPEIQEPKSPEPTPSSTPLSVSAPAERGLSPMLAGGAAAVLVLAGGAALFTRLRRR